MSVVFVEDELSLVLYSTGSEVQIRSEAYNDVLVWYEVDWLGPDVVDWLGPDVDVWVWLSVTFCCVKVLHIVCVFRSVESYYDFRRRLYCSVCTYNNKMINNGLIPSDRHKRVNRVLARFRNAISFNDIHDHFVYIMHHNHWNQRLDLNLKRNMRA